MNCAVFGVTPKSRCSFMELTPLRLVTSKYTTKAHLRSETCEASSAVPVLTER